MTEKNLTQYNVRRILFVLTITLITAGCTTSRQPSPTPSASTITSPTSTTDALFQKKIECAGLQQQIEARIKEHPLWNIDDRSTTLKKIFYSPKRNSCLYTMISIDTIGEDTTSNVRWTYSLYDALTNERIYDEIGCDLRTHCFQDAIQAGGKFNDLVAEYE